MQTVSEIIPASTASESFSYKTGFVVCMSLIAAMGGLLFGFDLGIITGAIPFLKAQFTLEGFALGWVVAIFELGCMFGTFIVAKIADDWGRKKSFLTVALFFIVTTLGAVSSDSVLMLATWRLLQGVAVGAASVLSPMYIAEIAPSKMRGKLVAANQLNIILGILLAAMASYYFGTPDNNNSWRWMFGSALIPSTLFFILLFIIPESPRWLVNKNLETNAHVVLSKIGNTHFVNNELEAIKQSLQQKQQSGSYAMLFGKTIFPVLFIAFGLAMLQQLCGSNNITAYLQVIFEKANISIKDGLLNAVFIGLVFFVFTILAMLLVDKTGRKSLLLIGTALLAIFLFLLAWSFNGITINGTLVFIFIMGFIGTYAFTLAPVTWVILSEIFPNYIRSKALSLSSAVLWLSCFLVVLVSPFLLKLSPVFNFILFGFFNVVGFVFVWRFVPETKNKTLEEIEKMLFEKKQ